MGSISAVSWSPLVWSRGGTRFESPSASLGVLSGFRRNAKAITNHSNSLRSPLLHSSFLPSSSLSFPSSVSGLSLGVELNSNIGFGFGSGKRRGLVVRAGKAALCLTKRSRSRKSLARTHGFRRRMRTTGGRAMLKRRRAKGRKILCTKSYPRTGKGS